MVMDLETMIGDETDPAAESLRGMLAQANMDLENTRTDLQMAEDNSADEMEIDRLEKAVTAAEGMRNDYMTKLNAANDELDGIGGAEGLRDKVARLEGKLADLRQKEAADKAADDLEEDSDMAKAVLAAIKANTVELPAPAVKLEASSDSMLTAELLGYTMSAAPEEIAGWRGRTLENADGDTTVIYTNIEDAEAKPIDTIYRAAFDPGQPAYYRVLDTLVDDTDKDILWSQAMRAEAVTTVGTGDAAVTTFAGKVRSVAGTFSCTGDCSAPTVADEATVLTAARGEWRFTPTDPDGTIDIADTAYVSFGWWLNAMGTGAYEFDAFASPSAALLMSPNTGGGSILKGSATYKGAAAGKYAILSTTDNSASGGHFTAAATLTANFDANLNGAGATNDENGVSIGGTITDFMTGDVSRPNWKVTMSYDDMVAEEGVQNAAAVKPIMGVMATTKWSTGGAVDGKGTWSANFHGEEEDTMHPMAATGEFNAAIGGGDIGRISGAFGATKQ